MVSTAGQRSRLVRTERANMEASEFQKEIFRLESTAESMNFLIYGDSNIGKTWLASTAPGKQFWLVGEPGYRSAARRGVRGYGRRITDTASAWGAIDFLEQNRRYEKFDWIILDGFTTMQDRWRLNYAAEAFDIDSAKRQHRNLPDKPDYFNTQNMVKSFIGRLVDMPVNFIITCHAWRTERSDVDMLIYPGIQGGVADVANAVSGLMDAVGYYGWKKIKSRKDDSIKMVRRLHWAQPPAVKDDELKYLVGDKYDCLGTHMDFPTMPQIISKIEGTERNEHAEG